MAEETRPKGVSRRDFLKGAAILSGAAVGAGILVGVEPETPAAAQGVPTPNAKFVLVHDTNKCVGCRRCEIACTLFHDGKVQPSISRVKVARNNQFGPEGPRLGFAHGLGLFGNFKVIADTCLQCAHPTPCLTACPAGAIEVDPKTNARVINAAKCTGCQTCLKACPWAMTSFDPETKKAVKCDLCGGDPQCVKWCSSGAMTYVPWRDMTKSVPVRQSVSSIIGVSAAAATTCPACHPAK